MLYLSEAGNFDLTLDRHSFREKKGTFNASLANIDSGILCCQLQSFLLRNLACCSYLGSLSATVSFGVVSVKSGLVCLCVYICSCRASIVQDPIWLTRTRVARRRVAAMRV